MLVEQGEAGAKEANALRRQNAQLAAALIWCGGSRDFAPGGVARKGWVRTVLPLLRRAGLAK